MMEFGKDYKLKHTTGTKTPSLEPKNRSIIKNNPAHKNLVLDLEETGMEVRMKIIDINGKVVANKMIAGEQEVTIQLDSICKPGTYILLINDEGKKTKEKFVVN